MSYTDEEKAVQITKSKAFPAPAEVDRYLYRSRTERLLLRLRGFPAPLEVDRYLYSTIRYCYR